MLRSPGRPLGGAPRALFESRLRLDLGAVRVHTDDRAAASAAAVGAAAYTVGRDVVFARGRYAPERPEGRRLLAHELGHVVQQRSAAASPPERLPIGGVHDPEEANADRTAGALASEPSPVTVLRRSIFSQIGGFFSSIFHGIFGFSKDSLESYLADLKKTDQIVGDPDSDDRARAIVEAWVADHTAFRLTPRLKALLILELLDGPTTASDERAIIDLLEGSDEADVRSILAPPAVDPQRLIEDLDDEAAKQRLERFFARRFVGGRAAVLAGGRELRPYLNLKAMLPEQADAFVRRHFADRDQELARKVLDDLRAVKAGEMDFESEAELRAEVFKRVRTSQLMRESQNSKMFGYPESLTSECEGFDRNTPPNLLNHARVNKAARNHWTLPVHHPDFFYVFTLSPLGMQNAFEALTLLFTPQPTICDRTLVHCDYLTSIIQLRAFAESIGPAIFDERVRSGAIAFKLTYFGAEYITATDQAAERGRFVGPASARSVSLQAVRPASEADLVIGDKVMFWNHLGYDAISVTAPGPWRLENAVLVDKNERDEDLFEGHGAPQLGGNIVPGPKAEILSELLTQYNRYVDPALDLTRQIEDGQPGARERLRAKFPQVEQADGGWIVRELPKNSRRPRRFYELRQLVSTDDPELIGLRDELDHSRMGVVERPVESREKPLP